MDSQSKAMQKNIEKFISLDDQNGIEEFFSSEFDDNYWDYLPIEEKMKIRRAYDLIIGSPLCKMYFDLRYSQVTNDGQNLELVRVIESNLEKAAYFNLQ